MEKVISRKAGDDLIHARLKTLIEVPTEAYLWTPSNTITFTPPLSSTIYGDGRALFSITTINDRPAWWVVRGDSGWQCSEGRAPRDAPDFGDFAEDIVVNLEDEFGGSRCGYSGNSLRWPAAERIENCQCDDCSDPEYVARFPGIDTDGGCSWGRVRWPPEFGVVDHPWDAVANLLAPEDRSSGGDHDP